jgi:hypothetical protein
METNNLLKTVRQFDNESNDTFKFRINYIESRINTMEFRKLIQYSKIAANIKFKKCKYDTLV